MVVRPSPIRPHAELKVKLAIARRIQAGCSPPSTQALSVISSAGLRRPAYRDRWSPEVPAAATRYSGMNLGRIANDP